MPGYMVPIGYFRVHIARDRKSGGKIQQSSWELFLNNKAMVNDQFQKTP